MKQRVSLTPSEVAPNEHQLDTVETRCKSSNNEVQVQIIFWQPGAETVLCLFLIVFLAYQTTMPMPVGGKETKRGRHVKTSLKLVHIKKKNL